MARDFSISTDTINYSGVPPISGLSTVSIVARCAGDSDTVNFGTILNCVNGANNSGIAFGRNSTQQVMYFAVRNGSGNLRTFPFNFDGIYRSVVMTFDGNASPKDVVYVDGVSQTISGTTFQATTIGTPTVHQISAPSGGRWNGRLAELGIYDRVITQGEAESHSDGASCLRFRRGLIFYAPFIRDVTDFCRGLTGTITGTTVTAHPRIYA